MKPGTRLITENTAHGIHTVPSSRYGTLTAKICTRRRDRALANVAVWTQNFGAVPRVRRSCPVRANEACAHSASAIGMDGHSALDMDSHGSCRGSYEQRTLSMYKVVIPTAPPRRRLWPSTTSPATDTSPRHRRSRR